MKKFVVLALVLAVASLANAGMLISVNGVIDPPDSSVVLYPSDVAILDIHGDGQTPQGAFYMGLSLMSTGPGSLDIGGAVLTYGGSAKDIAFDGDPDIAEYLGIQGPFINITLTDLVSPPAVPQPLLGLLVDGILFHCTGPGDVIISLFDGEGNLLDSQVIHQIIPEPMTVALLGLGGLFLRRRIA